MKALEARNKLVDLRLWPHWGVTSLIVLGVVIVGSMIGAFINWVVYDGNYGGYFAGDTRPTAIQAFINQCPESVQDGIATFRHQRASRRTTSVRKLFVSTSLHQSMSGSGGMKTVSTPD